MIEANPLQGTPEWFAQREGKLTASTFGAAAGMGPDSRQKVWRRHNGMEPKFMGNAATDWGIENEPVALAAYQVATGVFGDLVGFVPHPTMAWLGGSPDFYAGERGMGEIKCPYSAVIYPTIPVYYMAQMQGLMEVCDKDWCDFTVWTPESMSIRRVERSADYWDWLHIKLADWWMYVIAGVEPPRAKKEPPPETAHLILSDTTFNFN